MKFCFLAVLIAGTLAAQTPPANRVDPSMVVATVDGKSVTAGDIQKILDSTPALAAGYKQNPSLALEEYFVVRHLSDEATKDKLDQESPWKEQLEIARAQVLANAMANHERDGFPVSAAMMDDYYKRNAARYQQAKIKVIMIKFKSGPVTGTSTEDLKAAAQAVIEATHNPNLRTEAQAKEVAADVVKQIRAGADFAKMVAQYSDDDTSKASGGDFGEVKVSSAYPEDLKKAVFALKEGEVSDPVRQPSGFYIIRCEQKTAQPIDEVREAIIQDIRQTHLGDYIGGLRQRFTPKIEKPEFFPNGGGH